jgi:Holliday junction DNA helicase RuvA
MISSLRGKVARIWGNEVEVEVNGVGYTVWMGKKKFSEGDEVKIRTYMAVSENDMSLYGFEADEDLDLFKMLITVSGVGPKTGASILSNTDGAAVMKAIGEADVEFFKKIKGIGLKTAQRIIVDLKSKIGGLGELNLKDERPLLEDDVMLSLEQLGFDRKERERVLKLIPKDLVSTEDRLSWCLQNLSK